MQFFVFGSLVIVLQHAVFFFGYIVSTVGPKAFVESGPSILDGQFFDK